MLLQTNSYVVPKDKRSEHTRLLRKFRQTLLRLGCDSFEVFEQVGANWATGESTGRFVQIMRFRDRAQQLEVQEAEKRDPIAQQLIQEFCALINFPYQQQQGLFAVGFYNSALPVAPPKVATPQRPAGSAPPQAVAETPNEPENSPQPEQEQEQESQGSSLLDFNAITPDPQLPAPLRLTSETDSHSNGEYAELDEQPFSDEDREAILGELADEAEPESDEVRRQKAEG